jgi:hypothetical protein
MNPGILDSAGQVATSAIEAMKTAPVLIALVMLQGLTLGVVGWNVHARQSDMAEERRLFGEERKMFVELCVQQRTAPTNFRLESSESVIIPLPPLKPVQKE